MVEFQLYNLFDKEDRKVVEVKHAHQVDSNERSKQVSLLERLLWETTSGMSYLTHYGKFKCELYLHNLEKPTSIADTVELGKMIEDINLKQGKVVEIVFEERPSTVRGASPEDKQYYIIFDLLKDLNYPKPPK